MESEMHRQRDIKPTVTFPSAKHHCSLASTKLHCLATEAHVERIRPRSLHGSGMDSSWTWGVVITNLYVITIASTAGDQSLTWHRSITYVLSITIFSVAHYQLSTSGQQALVMTGPMVCDHLITASTVSGLYRKRLPSHGTRTFSALGVHCDDTLHNKPALHYTTLPCHMQVARYIS